MIQQKLWDITTTNGSYSVVLSVFGSMITKPRLNILHGVCSRISSYEIRGSEWYLIGCIVFCSKSASIRVAPLFLCCSASSLLRTSQIWITASFAGTSGCIKIWQKMIPSGAGWDGYCNDSMWKPRVKIRMSCACQNIPLGIYICLCLRDCQRLDSYASIIFAILSYKPTHSSFNPFENVHHVSLSYLCPPSCHEPRDGNSSRGNHNHNHSYSHLGGCICPTLVCGSNACLRRRLSPDRGQGDRLWHYRFEMHVRPRKHLRCPHGHVYAQGML